jgi:iodotyrosine deiodinase
MAEAGEKTSSEAVPSEGFEFYAPERFTPEQMKERLASLENVLAGRRSVRHFSPNPVPMDVLESAIRIASSAPSGAHKQPWTFCIVTDPKLKASIREAAEREELISYTSRMSERWLADIKFTGTDHVKPFIEEAPALIIVFKRLYELDDQLAPTKAPNYYVPESVGIATGFLLVALQQAGLAALTHTPSPMNFLGKLLGRPENERAFLNIPVGWPASDAEVPIIRRKSMAEVMVKYPGSEEE